MGKGGDCWCFGEDADGVEGVDHVVYASIVHTVDMSGCCTLYTLLILRISGTRIL